MDEYKDLLDRIQALRERVLLLENKSHVDPIEYTEFKTTTVDGVRVLTGAVDELEEIVNKVIKKVNELDKKQAVSKSQIATYIGIAIFVVGLVVKFLYEYVTG